MSAVDPEKKAIVQELLARRASLSPDKAQIVDELASRFGLSASADFSDVQGGSSTTPNTQRLLDMLMAQPPMQVLAGAGKEAMSVIQAGGQWMEDIPRQVREAMTGQQLPATVSPNRITATGADPLQPTNTLQKAGKVGADIGMGVAATMAAGPSVAGQVVGGAGSGMMLSDNPYVGAGIGATAPLVPAAVSAVKSKLPSALKSAASEKFNTLRTVLKDDVIMPTKADDIALEALEMGGRGTKTPGTGSTLTKVFSDYIKRRESSPAMTYDIGRKFAIRAGNLSAVEKQTTDKSMDRLLKSFSAALDDATREAAAKRGLQQVHDEAMAEWAKAMSREESYKNLAKAMKKSLVPLAIGGAGAGVVNTLTK